MGDWVTYECPNCKQTVKVRAPKKGGSHTVTCSKHAGGGRLMKAKKS